MKAKNITSSAGDIFIIYSDGITETTNKKGEEFGLERLRNILLDSYLLPTVEISEKIYKDLNAHGSGHDDQSLIIIRKK